MAWAIRKEALLRAPRGMMLTLVWSAFAACVIAASVYDVVLWFGGR